MERIIKKISLLFLSATLFLCLGFGLVSMSSVKHVYAESSMFMVPGAEIRVTGDFYGMRFKMAVPVGNYTESGYYGMIIIPEEYLTTYASELSENKNDYVTTFESIKVGVNKIPLLNIRLL